MDLEIGKIKVIGNPRTDFSGLDELVLSIKEQGVIVPLVVNDKNELIAGERRLRASKIAGLTKVPVRIIELDKEATEEAKIIENIQRKELNAVEEGVAFKKYLVETSHTEEHLAKKLGKPVDYVKRRILIVNLSQTVKDAIIQNKIKIGHALLLAKMNNVEARKFLKVIITDKHSVERAKTALQYSSFSQTLADACFDTKDCKGCQFNGSVQSELFETGKVLNGKCMNQKCFYNKVSGFVKSKRKEYANVLWEGEYYQTPKGFVDTDSWRAEQILTKAEIRAIRKERNPKSYLVSVDERGRVREFIKPIFKNNEPPKQELTATKEQRLKSRIHAYKYDEMKKIGSGLAKNGMKQVKVLCLYQLLKNYRASIEKQFKNIFGYCFSPYSDKFMKIFYGEDEAKLDQMYVEISKVAMYDLDFSETEKSSKAFGLDWEKHFSMNEEFLKLYTKEQLVNLGDELGVKIEPTLKLVEMKNCFMEQKNLEAIKGKVPKVLI